MFAVLHALGMCGADLFKSRSRFEAENLLLRHQLTIALRRAPSRFRLLGSDRALLVGMTRLWPSLLGAVQVVQPETILRWHRAGFKMFWRWKSRHRAGRPRIDRGLRDLIQRMSRENSLWGASRIHGELLMLGFELAQSTVSKYMVRRGNPPSQTWKTFLQNHAEAISAIDMCVVPTLTFDLLFAFLVLGHGRRQLLWFDTASDSRVAGPADHRGVSLDLGAGLPSARQRPCLRTCLHVSGEGDGYPRSADRFWIAVAEWVCSTSNRHIAPRMPGSNAHRRRGAPAASSFRLCGVLQSSAHALGITERCALTSSSSTIWRHCRHSDLGWTASPIRPDMIFGKDNTLSIAECP